MDFPKRLKTDKGMVGRDFPGCISSGHATAIMKSSSAAKYLDKPFVVGGVFAIQFNLTDIIIGEMRGKKHPDAKRFKVRFFKTYKGAKAHFNRLQEKVNEAYAEVKQAKKTAQNPLASKDERWKAVCTLSDHGQV